MSSEVKLGYKWTEAGVIPEDWCIKPLAELCTFENGDRGKNYPSPGSFVSSGIPFINAGHLSNGNIDLRQMDYISPERFNKLGGGKVRNGDILFCLRGSLGKFGVITSEITCGAIASSLVIIRQKSSSITQEYLISYFSSELCASMIEIWAGGAAQPNLGAQDLAKFLVAMPQSQDEQKKIASALADADALISSLDQLIAKKRDIQQATMQQLLTGQRRLPGFTEEWGFRRLSELLVMPATYGVVTAGAFVSNGVPMLRGGDIKNSSISLESPHITKQKSEEYSRTILKENDVIVALVGYPGEAARVPREFGGSNISRAVGLLRLNHGVLPDFLVCYLNSVVGRKSFLTPSAGSAQVVVNLKDLNALMIPTPDIAEQTAIATILSDMHVELATLEARRDKAHQIKRGMMQELLAGRIRLPQDN